MVYTHKLNLAAALAVSRLVPHVLAHGHGDSLAAEAPSGSHGLFSNGTSASLNMTLPQIPESYFSYPERSGWMLAHVIFMTIAWFFVLPIGKLGLWRTKNNV